MAVSQSRGPQEGEEAAEQRRRPERGREAARGIKSALDFFVLLQQKGAGSGPEPAGRGELCEALRDLVRAYEDPEVQQEVLAALQQCQAAIARGETGPKSQGDWAHCLGLLLTPLQIAVARDHGFSASVGGLQKMQNAIVRRICEGDSEFRELANRALGLLALPQVEQLTCEVSAEDLLCRIEAQQMLATAWTPVETLLDVLEGGGRDAGKLREKLRRMCERRRTKGSVHLGALATWAAWERCGLGQDFVCRPLRPRSGGVARLCRPSASEVFQFVMENRPLVITGALTEQTFPPLEDFRDFEYLKSRCGHRLVGMKGDPSFDGFGRKVFVNDPFVSLRLEEYLGMIEEAERSGGTAPFYMGKVNLGVEVPEMLEDVDASAASPWRAYRSAFGRLKDGVHSYFGCGLNTTSIHADPSENLLVVVVGRKTFQLFPPCDADCLYTTMKKPLNSCVPPLTRPQDMPEELLERFPLYEHASPVTVELSAGDILYLPIFWWHGVAGGQGRNMILNWWAEMHPSKAATRVEPEGEMTIREFVQGIGGAAA